MVVWILEGVQGVGKTAIINSLLKTHVGVKQLDWPRTTQASNAKEYVPLNIENTYKTADAIRAKAHGSTIHLLDRYTASEFVFGHICERPQAYGWLNDLEFILASFPVLLVYMHSDYDFIVSNIWNRRSAYVAELMVKNLPAAFYWYERYLEKTPLKYVTFRNNPALSVDENADMLYTHIRTWADAQVNDRRFDL